MVKGTTPLQTFILPSDASDYPKIIVTYEGVNYRLEKQKSDFTIEENKCSFYLTQEETLCFKDGETVKVQVKVLDAQDRVFASKIFYIPVTEILNKTILEADEDEA